jgi:hypothetical protein
VTRADSPRSAGSREASVDLFWLPLGAGRTVVRRSGRLFETVAARRAGRRQRDLYHAALEVTSNGERFVIEMAPVWGNREPDRGVVGEGPVGLRPLGRSRLFRYEVRCWRDGVIPDIATAVGGRHRLSADPDRARLLLDLLPAFPLATWGRDELDAADMWNSNSLVAWLLAGAGVNHERAALPENGRAPGWSAGLVVSRRDTPTPSSAADRPLRS